MGLVESALTASPDPQLEEYLQQLYRESGYSRHPHYALHTGRFGGVRVLPVQDARFVLGLSCRYSDPYAFASDARSLVALQVNKVPHVAPLLGVEAKVKPQGITRTFETSVYFEYPLFLLDDYVRMLKFKAGAQPLKADELLRILKIGVACIAFLSQNNEVHGEMRASSFAVYRKTLDNSSPQQQLPQNIAQPVANQVPKIDLSNGLRDLDIKILPILANKPPETLLASAQLENTLSNLRTRNPSLTMLAPELKYKLEEFGTNDPVDPYTNKKIPFLTDKSDLFSLGLMILELGTLIDIVPQVSKPNAMVDQEALMRAEHMFTLQHGDYHSLPDILSKMLSLDPMTRIHPQELHRFLEDPSPKKIFPYSKVVSNLVLTSADRNNTAGRQVGFDIYGRPVYEGGTNTLPGQGIQAGGNLANPARPETQGKPEYSLPPLFGALDVAPTPPLPILQNAGSGPQGRNMLSNQQQPNLQGAQVDKTKLVQEYLSNLNALSNVLMEIGPSRDPEIQRLQEAILRPRESGVYSQYGGAYPNNNSWADTRLNSAYSGSTGHISMPPTGFNHLNTLGQPVLMSEPPMASSKHQVSHLRSAHAELELANSQVFQRQEFEREAAKRFEAHPTNHLNTSIPAQQNRPTHQQPIDSDTVAKSVTKYQIFG